jgi:hypothetical protein
MMLIAVVPSRTVQSQRLCAFFALVYTVSGGKSRARAIARAIVTCTTHTLIAVSLPEANSIITLTTIAVQANTPLYNCCVTYAKHKKLHAHQYCSNKRNSISCIQKPTYLSVTGSVLCASCNTRNHCAIGGSDQG